MKVENLQPDARSIEVRKLSLASIAEISAIEQYAHKMLGDGYRPCDQEAMKRILDQGFSLGAFDKGKLIAIRLARSGPEIDIDLAEKLQVSETTVELYGVVVTPDYQGLGLGFELTDILLKNLSLQGYDTFFTTVAIANFRSLNNLFRANFHIRKVELFYGKSIRFILYKTIKPGVKSNEIGEEIIKYVRSGDVQMHKDMLRDGWFGIRTRGSESAFSIGYSRRPV